MTIFDVLTLICGLSLFLFGMEVMSDALKKSAGNKLKTALDKMTTSKLKGFLLGCGVTALIQSSSATTVMVVGFVNSGTMTLSQSVGVIMGANVGTGVTAWITGLSGIGAGEGLTSAVQWLQPSSWMPLVALVGILLIMFTKTGRKRDIGYILLGFAVLMVGMELMSDGVSPLKNDESFKNLLVAFNNPVLGLLTGLVFTAAIQSSSASVGILQSLTATGAITYSTAIPIVMGQNIGTCVTALISAAGATKNGKRAALIHLYYNVISAIVFLALFVILKSVFTIPLLNEAVGTIGIAVIHTIFKLLSVALFAPLTKQLEKLATISVREGKNSKKEKGDLLDDRLLTTPAVAIERANLVATLMEQLSLDSVAEALDVVKDYKPEFGETIRDQEEQVDKYEDELGTYLVKINSTEMDEKSSREVTKLLHLLSDFERISDHAVDIIETAEEMRAKNLDFSVFAKNELDVLFSALKEILENTKYAFEHNDIARAGMIEPLEQTIDALVLQIKDNHVSRLRSKECTIEQGFILSDLLTSCARISDHCSNVAGLIIEISKYDAMNMHEYLNHVKSSGEEFKKNFDMYIAKYHL